MFTLCGCGSDPKALREQARADWTAGRLDEAERGLARLADLRPPDLQERLLRAQVARQRGRVDEAVEFLGDAGPDAPAAEAAVVASTRGTLELARHRFRDAEAALALAVDLDPSRAEARRELVNLYALQNRQADLSNQFRALAQADGEPLSFADLYLWTLGRREDAGPAELAETLGKATTADPGDRASRLALAENLRRLGRLNEARIVLGLFAPGDADAKAALARLALDRGDAAAAERLLTLTGARPHPASARLLGRIALARGDAVSAERAFRAAVEAEPDDRDGGAGLAQALRLAGKAGDAVDLARYVRDRDRLEWLVQNARPAARRDDPATLRAVGDVCRDLGRTALARAWYRLALSKNPLDVDLQKSLFRLDEEAASPSSWSY